MKGQSSGRTDDPDEALRTAIEAALVARDFERVKALVAVLEATKPGAPVIDLVARTRGPR